MGDKSGIVAAAFSAQLGVNIKCKEDAHQHAALLAGQTDLKKIAINTLFSHCNDVVSTNPNCHCVKVFGDARAKHDIDPCQYKNVGAIKEALASKVGVHPSCLQLMYDGKPLRDDLSLAQQGVHPGTQMLLAKTMKEATEPDQTFYVDSDDLDPRYDYDFTYRVDDGTKYMRGGLPYTRPYGWDRAALNVLGHYPDNVWLGQSGKSGVGEWAVSYHGTAAKNIRPISDDGYDMSKSVRQAYGPGIYSSPAPTVGESYAKAFPFKGKQYKMMLQNRVNMAKSNRRIFSGGDYIITPDDDDIRPYGVCLKAI